MHLFRKELFSDRLFLAKFNILVSFFIKGGSALLSFIVVPLTIDYLNPEEYGIWLTINSFLSWFIICDIGIADGLKNRLVETFAFKKYSLAKSYISTAYNTFSIIILLLVSIFYILSYWVNWNQFFNVEYIPNSTLQDIIDITFAIFGVTLVFKLISNIYMAKQLPLVNDVIIFLGQFFAICFIYLLKEYTQGSLLWVAIAYSSSQIIPLIGLSLYTYDFKYKYLSPRAFYIRLKSLKSITKLGFQFFFIQIGSVIMLATSNFIIAQLIGPESVTIYNIAYKYLGIIFIFMNIIVSPIWTSVADAYTKKEYSWIDNLIKRMTQIWMGTLIITIMMVIISPIVYKYWVDIEVQWEMTIWCAIYFSIMNWNSIFNNYLKGVGKIKMQIYCTIFASIIYIPLALLGNWIDGMNGILIAMCLSLIPTAICAPLQYYKISRLKAKGIWNA